MSSWIFSQLYWRDDDRVVYSSSDDIHIVVVTDEIAAPAAFPIEIEIDRVQ